MSGLENKARREFLKTIVTLGTVGTAVVTTTSILSAGAITPLLLLDNEDPGPISKKEAEYYKEWSSSREETKPRVIEKNINSTKFKFCGVRHSRDTARYHYELLEKAVKKSSVVVIESAMGPLNKIFHHYHVDAAHTPGAFFSTTASLCKKYGKPVIDLDSITGRATLAEFSLGIGGALYSLGQINKVLKSFEPKKINRRELLKSGAKMMGGAYLALSSMFSSILSKGLTYKLILKREDKYFEHEKYYLSHAIDQRNIKITERLLELPNLLEKEDLERGEYILSVFGNAHVVGVNYYMNHPTQRKLKSLVYKYTYDFLDHDGISKYVPEGNSWRKVILKSRD